MATFTPFSEEVIKRYNDGRLLNVRRKLCHAPFQNLYFGRDGKATSCCYNRTVVLGSYPEQSLLEIWTGEKMQQFRAEMTEQSIGKGCDYCVEQLEAGNIAGLHAKLYDRYADAPLGGFYQKAASLIKTERSLTVLHKEWRYFKSKIRKLFSNRRFAQQIGQIIQQEIKHSFQRFQKTDSSKVIPDSFPRSLEFELSNICNLECAMCSGDFSSSIRKNREQLAPLPMYYDASFVQQLAAFLPQLWEAKFYGGEPFLIPIYYDIWESMIQINPNITIHITTNGTILNERVKRVLEKLNVVLILSIDSFEKETYEAIRINAGYERVMEHLKYFEKIAKTKQSILNIAVCPMQLNWKEIPRMVQICNEKGINIFFNTVWYPVDLSLRSFSSDVLNEVIDYYESFTWEYKDNSIDETNVAVFKGLIAQLKSWLNTQEKTEIATTKFKDALLLIRQQAASNPLYEIMMRINTSQTFNKETLELFLENAFSPQAFIDQYFETIYQAIALHQDAIKEERLSQLRSIIDTARHQVFTHYSESAIIEKILYNNHVKMATFLAQITIEALHKTDEIFFPVAAVNIN